MIMLDPLRSYLPPGDDHYTDDWVGGNSPGPWANALGEIHSRQSSYPSVMVKGSCQGNIHSDGPRQDWTAVASGVGSRGLRLWVLNLKI